MEIADFIEATNTAASAEDIFSLYLKAVSDQGFDRVMYSMLPKKREHSEDQYAPAIVRNYPDDWIKHYVASGYVETDPVRRMGLVSRRPFTWAELPKSGHFKKRDLRIFPEAEEAHLYDGVGIPLHGPRGGVFGVGMASSTRGVEPERQLSKLNVITVQFHVAYSALTLPVDQLTPVVHLSAREREILQWCMIGK